MGLILLLISFADSYNYAYLIVHSKHVVISSGILEVDC